MREGQSISEQRTRSCFDYFDEVIGEMVVKTRRAPGHDCIYVHFLLCVLTFTMRAQLLLPGSFLVRISRCQRTMRDTQYAIRPGVSFLPPFLSFSFSLFLLSSNQRRSRPFSLPSAHPTAHHRYRFPRQAPKAWSMLRVKPYLSQALTSSVCNRTANLRP